MRSSEFRIFALLIIGAALLISPVASVTAAASIVVQKVSETGCGCCCCAPAQADSQESPHKCGCRISEERPITEIPLDGNSSIPDHSVKLPVVGDADADGVQSSLEVGVRSVRVEVNKANSPPLFILNSAYLI